MIAFIGVIKIITGLLDYGLISFIGDAERCLSNIVTPSGSSPCGLY